MSRKKQNFENLQALDEMSWRNPDNIHYNYFKLFLQSLETLSKLPVTPDRARGFIDTYNKYKEIFERLHAAYINNNYKRLIVNRIIVFLDSINKKMTKYILYAYYYRKHVNH